MTHRALRGIILSAATIVLAGCGTTTLPPSKATEKKSDKPDSQPTPIISRSAEKPMPPLQLTAPPPLPERIGDQDFKSMDADDLFIFARMAASNRSYNVATVAQYWYVQKTKTGQYDLACYLAQTGRIDPAFYWLQRAAIEEGVDTQHAQRDEDLESLRADPRWEKVLRYMQDCNQYFESASITRTVLILPKGYKKPTLIPAVLWLHGLGSRPEGFVNDGCQEFADELNVALIGVSGTKARGPRSFVWAEEVEENARRIHAALAEVSDRVTVQKGHLITLGFSQGAQVGLEVAVRNPEEYAGSIVLSPGAQPHLEDVKPSPLLARRGYVLCCGAKEHPGNVRLTALDAGWLRRAKAQVIHKEYPDVSTHSFPADFSKQFPEWVRFILKTRGD